MNLATITAGAYKNSESVTVSAVVSNGTTVVVYRGEFLLGSATVTSNVATVAVPPLAIGDVIQASVTERGNQAGIPVTVGQNPQAVTGWIKPTDLKVNIGTEFETAISSSAYKDAYGEDVGAVYSPLVTGLTQLPADYDKAPVVELGFDVEVIQQPGTTTVRVVARNDEGLLVGWNGATPSSPAALVLTASSTVTVSVQRDDDPGETLTRSLSIVVLPAPTSPSTPAAGDIGSAAYRNYGAGFIRAMINCRKPCEAQLVGYSSSWITATARDPDFLEADWVPVPSGTYTCNCRVIGETNPSNYFTFTIIVS